ncbi:MAG: hypothetical protein II180_03945, partial [Proteobacteria bacterium]|nr:hypothetical protein [Pseudomonadota bacterium]
ALTVMSAIEGYLNAYGVVVSWLACIKGDKERYLSIFVGDCGEFCGECVYGVCAGRIPKG